MHPKRQQKIEQGMAELRELLPASWWALYSGCLDRGFTPAQAMGLVRTHILGSQGCPIFLAEARDVEKPDEEDSPKGSK